jgi:hypothetical protein
MGGEGAIFGSAAAAETEPSATIPINNLITRFILLPKARRTLQSALTNDNPNAKIMRSKGKT